MDKKIIINLAQQTLKAYEHGALVLNFMCVTGDARHRTPKGNFKVIAKHRECKNTELNAQMNFALKLTKGGICIHESYIAKVPGFPEGYINDMSDAWSKTVSMTRGIMPASEYMNWEFFQKNINLMGSHGCIRLGHSDAVQLFSWTPGETPVTIE